MPRRPALFRKSDFKRAVNCARENGIEVGAVEIDAQGKIVIVSATERQPPNQALDARSVAMERIARMGNG